MAESIGGIYGRVVPFVRAAPLAAALVLAAELLQHAVEIRLGMYRAGMELPADAERTRLAFGAVKILAIFLALLFALRWWRFDGDARRAARPTLALFKGLAIVILVQVAAETLLLAIGALAGRAFVPSSGGARAALMIAPLLAWMFVATLLYPWYVGLLTEDRAMTLRRSVRGIWGRMGSSFGLLLAAILPAMIVHYALGYAAIGRPEALVWTLMIVDAAVVALLAILIASAYFTLYNRAAERAPAAA